VRADDVALVGGLCLEFPELRELLQEHLDDYDGLLPHLLLADVTRWLVARLSEKGRDDALLASVLGFVEDHFASGSEHVSELIAVSILETMPLKGEDGAELRELLGPAMRDYVERHLTW
jgi:hypothetical protein